LYPFASNASIKSSPPREHGNLLGEEDDWQTMTVENSLMIAVLAPP